MNILFPILTGLAMLAVLGTLFAGLVTMVRGSDGTGHTSNKLMRLRVLMQGLALLFFALAMLTSA